jgi:hypothetical protein
MAHSITLGKVAQRTDTLDIRSGRWKRHGRLNGAAAGRARPDAPMAELMRAQIDDAQIQIRCDPQLPGPRAAVPHA